MRHWWGWALGLFLLACGLIVPFLGFGERSLVWFGGAYQILGFVMTAVAIDQRRRLFSMPHPVRAFLERWESRPRFGSVSTQVPVSGSSIGISAMTARGLALAGADKPIDERLAALERSFRNLFSQVGEIEKNGKRVERELRAAIANEIAQRQKEDAAIQEQMRLALAEGILVEWVGIAFFVIGVVIATCAVELAS